MRILITGRSGTGKSTVYRELLKRELLAFEGDHIADWYNKKTGKPLDKAKGYPGDSQVDNFYWNWDGSALKQLLHEHKDIFVCGNADNATDFYMMFDRVFILTLDEQEQRRRIMRRAEHDYGKNKYVQDEIIAGQVALVQKALSSGAVALDAGPTPSQIVDNILSNIS